MDINEKLERFEQKLANLKLDKRFKAITTVERDLGGEINPGIILQDMIVKRRCFPSFRNFFEYYCSAFKTQLDAYAKEYYPNLSEEEFKLGIEARLYRTQCSILTDLQAFLMCRKVFGSGIVTRDSELDRRGVDFTIFYNNRNNRIHIFIDSYVSWQYRRGKKDIKDSDGIEGVHINLPYTPWRQIGKPDPIHLCKMLPNGFGVYDVKYGLYLKEQMDNNYDQIVNQNIIGVNDKGFIFGE